MIRRTSLGLTVGQVWDFSIIFSLSSLISGRIYHILVYERSLFRENILEVFAFWHGGISLNGVILGYLFAFAVFCSIHKKRYLFVADEMVIPAVLCLALCRIGNHLNGELYGYVTSVWWAVKFPYAEGFRHPVAIYGAIKNFLLIPILISTAKRVVPGQGKLFASFLFWYGLLGIVTDYFRYSPHAFLDITTDPFYNAVMALMGMWLIVRTSRKDHRKTELKTLHFAPAAIIAKLPSKMNFATCFKAAIFVSILLFCLTIPSGWSHEWLGQLAESNKIPF